MAAGEPSRVRKKPSPRAMILLRLVAHETKIDWATGKVEKQFYTGTGYASRHRTIPRVEAVDGVKKADEDGNTYQSGELEVFLCGSGDLAALKSLLARGLIAEPPAPTGSDRLEGTYVLTEEGHAFLERWKEGLAS